MTYNYFCISAFVISSLHQRRNFNLFCSPMQPTLKTVSATEEMFSVLLWNEHANQRINKITSLLHAVKTRIPRSDISLVISWYFITAIIMHAKVIIVY